MWLFVLKQPVIAGLTINYRLFMHNRWDQKLNPQLRALPHGKEDGPRRTPKNVALLLVSSKVTLLDSFSSFQIFRELHAKSFKWSFRMGYPS